VDFGIPKTVEHGGTNLPFVAPAIDLMGRCLLQDKATTGPDVARASITGGSEDESDYRSFPTSVPVPKDLNRLEHTMIIRKVNGPS